MGSPLGSSLSNIFLAYREQNWLARYSLECRSLHYQQIVEDVFTIFKSSDHLSQF